MTTSQRASALAPAVAGWLGACHAQLPPAPPVPSAPEMLLTTPFRRPLAYNAALAWLDHYSSKSFEEI